MKAPVTWREMLAEITKECRERERIARELKVHPVTINRWVNHESVPRLDNLRRLLNVIPEQRERFLALLLHEFPDIALHMDADEALYTIASAFYARVFKMYVTTPVCMRFCSLGKLILQHLLKLLDPEQQHVAVLLLKCQPPSQQKIRSLRVVMGVGTPPWGGNIDTQSAFLGAVSFIGQAFLADRTALIENSEAYSGLLPGGEYAVFSDMDAHASPKIYMQRIASEMATPIICADKRAGVLYVCSTHAGSLHSSHLQMLQEYASLIALAFMPADFYAREDILLHVMPPPWVQIPFLLQMPDRILELMRVMTTEQLSVDRSQAEEMAWQQVEEELIQHASSHRNMHNRCQKMEEEHTSLLDAKGLM